MKRIESIPALALCFVLCLGLSACDNREGQTIESAYIYPLEPAPRYSFSRHGSTSVDYRDVDLLENSLSVMYRSYLAPANVGNEVFWQMLMNYYESGYHQGYAPLNYVARSERVSSERMNILRDLQKLLDETARISGYAREGIAHVRNTVAVSGTAGYIGDRHYYVDSRGLVVADVFALYARGAIYLDQLYNVHTTEQVLFSQEMERLHEDLVLLSGKNYTSLEHAWDMTYGCYRQWRSLLKGDGIPMLKGKDQAIFEAFVRGRVHIGYYDYNSLRRELTFIRTELARAIAVRAIHLLTGANTIANLNEEAPYAYQSISQAIGLIYCLAFTQDDTGKPYLSYQEAQALSNVLLSGEGLWDIERLKADAEHEGSLAYVATTLARKVGLSLR